MENLNKVINILLTIKKASISINDDAVFYIHKDKVDEIKKYLSENGVEINDILHGDQIEIERSFYIQNNIQPYKDFKNYFNRFELSDFGGRTIIILQEGEQDTVVFNNNEIPTSYFFQSGKQDFKAPNYYFLKKIIEIFFPRIVDYIDSTHNKYILLSPECGKFEIPAGNISEIAGIEKSLEDTYKAIEKILSFQKGWEPIIKNRIIRGLEVYTKPEEYFYWLIGNLEQFVTTTIRDYDVFSASHNHETILERYEHEKDIFSDKIRTVLERVSTNLLSIPITFSVALFGLREINEKWLINIFIIALFVFVFFSCSIQGLFIMELNIIRKEIHAKKDYFLKLLPTLNDYFNNISKPQLQKITLLQVLTGLIIVAFIFLCYYLICNYINSPIKDR